MKEGRGIGIYLICDLPNFCGVKREIVVVSFFLVKHEPRTSIMYCYHPLSKNSVFSYHEMCFCSWKMTHCNLSKKKNAFL